MKEEQQTEREIAVSGEPEESKPETTVDACAKSDDSKKKKKKKKKTEGGEGEVTWYKLQISPTFHEILMFTSCSFY